MPVVRIDFEKLEDVVHDGGPLLPQTLALNDEHLLGRKVLQERLELQPIATPLHVTILSDRLGDRATFDAGGEVVNPV